MELEEGEGSSGWWCWRGCQRGRLQAGGGSQAEVGRSPAEVRQAGRGAECGWDGARPGPTQARPARASRTGKMHARPRLVPVSRAHPELELQQEGKGNNGEGGSAVYSRCPQHVFLWYIQPWTAYSLHHILTSTYLRIKSATDVQMLKWFKKLGDLESITLYVKSFKKFDLSFLIPIWAEDFPG